MSKKLLIGCDPEVFIYDKSSLKYVSSIGRIGGNKDVPSPLFSSGFYALEDNVMVEFNVPPANNSFDLFNNIQIAQSEIKELFLKDNELLSNIAAVEFEFEQLNNPQAQEFGCMPELIVWTGKETKANAKDAGLLRTAGGHIHVGFSDMNKENMVKALDLTLGVPSVLIDEDIVRNKLYGKAGSYRNKPYGVEYRVLSNYWINNSKIVDWIFKQVNLALSIHNTFDFNRFEKDIVSCINSNDSVMAKAICQEFKLVLPKVKEKIVMYV